MGGAQTHPARQRDGGLRFRIEEQMRGEGNTSYSRFRDGESSSLKIRPGRKTTMKTSHGMCQRSVLQKTKINMEKNRQYSQGQSNATRVQDHSNRCFSLQANFLQANAVQRIIRNPACPAVHLVDPRCLTPAAPRPQVATGAPPPTRAPPLPGHPPQLGHPNGRQQRAP